MKARATSGRVVGGRRSRRPPPPTRRCHGGAARRAERAARRRRRRGPAARPCCGAPSRTGAGRTARRAWPGGRRRPSRGPSRSASESSALAAASSTSARISSSSRRASSPSADRPRRFLEGARVVAVGEGHGAPRHQVLEAGEVRPGSQRALHPGAAVVREVAPHRAAGSRRSRRPPGPSCWRARCAGPGSGRPGARPSRSGARPRSPRRRPPRRRRGPAGSAPPRR